MPPRLVLGKDPPLAQILGVPVHPRFVLGKDLSPWQILGVVVVVVVVVVVIVAVMKGVIGVLGVVAIIASIRILSQPRSQIKPHARSPPPMILAIKTNRGKTKLRKQIKTDHMFRYCLWTTG
jgi:hypothetical protein